LLFSFWYPQEKKIPIESIDIVAQALREDKLILVPTETVFGLMVAMNSSKALEKLLTIKRKREKPFQLLVIPIWLRQYADISEGLLNNILTLVPSEITFVLKAKEENIPPVLRPYLLSYEDGTPYVGLRVPKMDQVLSLILSAGMPIIATSANYPDSPPVSSIEEAESLFGDIVDLFVLPPDNWTPSKPSTVVKVIQNATEISLEVLREGAFPISLIEQALLR